MCLRHEIWAPYLVECQKSVVQTQKTWTNLLLGLTLLFDLSVRERNPCCFRIFPVSARRSDKNSGRKYVTRIGRKVTIRNTSRSLSLSISIFAHVRKTNWNWKFITFREKKNRWFFRIIAHNCKYWHLWKLQAVSRNLPKFLTVFSQNRNSIRVACVA